ncbi:AKNA factor, partial [Campylorhamphus procurvoides]|nr:AKNA factor [Campylorhamphus procurvoides]
SPTGVPSLQDDYHKLLTKYAEAENTIDQLRLGARVSLFSDPPQPSRSLSMGTVGTGCPVVTLSIPQARTAALGMATATASPAGALGASEPGGSPHSPSPPPPAGGCPTCPGPCCCPGPRMTRALAGQSRRLQAQARVVGAGWVSGRAGWDPALLVPQRMRLLKDAQDALEREYLRGRQQLPGAAAGFDPDRAVEDEIYRLGLRLEGLKERLEPGGRWQPPLHPVLVEGPLGTAGDSEEVTGVLPWPLWHKQLCVEEDFGDLLEQYKHFKTLPESLSLEQLSLVESVSQEEVDAPAAGNGGPSKVPCRTRSLEEGTDLETFPLHPPERRAAPLPPGGPPKAEGTRGHPSPATTEEPLATPKPPLGVPAPPGAPLSRRSSGTGSAATQHGSRKVSPLALRPPPDPAGGPGVLSTHPALPMPLQEQRIVSPETDSGFVGSEASRVSPPVHTPEHRPPGTGTSGSLGPSIPIPTTLRAPRKRETTPLPSETALMGIYPTGGQGGTGGPCLPPSTPSQSSSPPRWAESAGSEAEPDPDGDGGDTPMPHAAHPGSLCSPSSPAHTDSEVGDRSCAGASGHPPAMARRVPPSPSPSSPPPSPETPSPPLLSPDLPSLDPAPCDLLGSRLERDQAIRELQAEVWRLRRRLEESLRRSRSYPEGKATPRVPPARRQPVGSGPSSPKDAAPSG